MAEEMGGFDHLTNLECCELVEVSCKQSRAANILHEMLRDGPGQAKPIVSGCATPQLIDDDQRIAACTLHRKTAWIL
jgi:hypothetical protein